MNQYTNNLITREDREKAFKEKFNKRYPTLEYVRGYVDSDKPLIVRCKICGNEFTRLAYCIRGKSKTTCFYCKKKKRETKETIEKAIKIMQRNYVMYWDKTNKEIDKIYSKFKKNTIHIKKCVVCNKEFEEHTTSKYCTLCRKKIRKHHSGKSLKQLYERDNGICLICGGKCNWNDKKEINGTIIVGNTYPSIDHIIPIVKGGTDDWNNLQLAHFKCNWVKGGCLED